MLTGKAKSVFEKWYWNDWLTASDRDYNEKDEVIENAWKAEKMFLFPLIIEWMDSVGIHVEVGVYPSLSHDGYCYTSSVYGEPGDWEGNTMYSTRQEATKQSIIKANEIYNSHKNSL